MSVAGRNRNIYEDTTIAAISTAMAPAGLGIVRVSGPEAFKICDRIFRAGKDVKPGGGEKGCILRAEANTIHYGYIFDGNEPIDEVLVSVLRAPHSFTAEDTCEINCHGGPRILKKVLDLLLKNGAALAEPGEFTRRAFLNGRIDLMQAEAVGELIRSKSDMAGKDALSKIRGEASSKIRKMREDVLYEMASIEAAMDDPEHISIEGCAERLKDKLFSWQIWARDLLDEAERGRIVNDGIRTVLVGRTNVGKSSVLNLLLGKDRAIVTEVAGTTRDTLEETISWGGIALRLIDTAGIRETTDPVELIGVDRAKNAIEQAELILLIADASRGVTDEDMRLERECEGKTVIALWNKSDLAPDADTGSWGRSSAAEPVRFSAKTGQGIKELKSRIEEIFFSGGVLGTDVWYANSRQTAALAAALDSFRLVSEAIEAGISEDMYTIDLADAYRALGTILGEEVEDELIDKIFAEFCMGK